MENKNMRKLNVTVQCMAVYNSSIMVPRELTFEQLGFDDMEFNAEQKSEGAAIKFIHEWMKG